MHNKYRLIFTFFLFSIFITGYAQTKTYSPYSRYGLGEIQDGGFGRNAGMGHTGIALTSSYNLNNINPASYFSMDSVSFFFEGGVSGYKQKLKSDGLDAEFSDMSFSYFAIGFPVSGWGFMSIGLKPETVVGYQFFDDNEQGGISIDDDNYYINNASGKGNTTKAYAGVALSPVDNLSLGIHISYLFGSVKHYSLTKFPNDNIASKIGTTQSLRINDIYLDFGIQYRIRLKERQNLVIGAIYNPKTKMKGDVTTLTALGNSLESGGMTVIAADTLYYSKDEFKGNAMELPEKYGLGAAYNIDDFLTVTADYSTTKWSETNFHEVLTANNKTTITDSEKFAFGLEILPNYRSADSYFAKVKYRLGTSYKKDYVVINGDQLTDFGITFGVGLPLKRSKTSFNLAFEWGQRGVKDLIEEDYVRFSLNMTLHEFWFMKRKFE